MSIIEDIKKGGVTTLAIGAGVLALVPAALPVLAQGARPFLRGVIKGSLVCLEKGQEAVAEIRHVLDDVAAESRTDIPMGKSAAEMAAEPVPPKRVMSEPKPIMANNGEPDPEVMG